MREERREDERRGETRSRIICSEYVEFCARERSC